MATERVSCQSDRGANVQCCTPCVWQAARAATGRTRASVVRLYCACIACARVGDVRTADVVRDSDVVVVDHGRRGEVMRGVVAAFVGATVWGVMVQTA